MGCKFRYLWPILRDSAIALPQDEGCGLKTGLATGAITSPVGRGRLPGSGLWPAQGQADRPGEGASAVLTMRDLAPHPDPLPIGRGNNLASWSCVNMLASRRISDSSQNEVCSQGCQPSEALAKAKDFLGHRFVLDPGGGAFRRKAAPAFAPTARATRHKFLGVCETGQRPVLDFPPKRRP